MARKKKNSEVSFADIGQQLADSLAKDTKNTDIQLEFGVKTDSVDNVKYWVDTGSSFLNLAISNMKDGGGYPSGRLTILFGEEQAGKSLLCMHAIAATQKMGGIALYIDCERAMHEGFAKAIGVDLESPTFMKLSNSNIGVILTFIEKYIVSAREKFGNEVPITVCLDSLTAAKTEEEMKGAYEEEQGYNTGMSKLLSRAMPALIPLIQEHNICFLVTNQVRQNLNRSTPFESKFRMAGGQSVPHYASVIVRLQKTKMIKGEVSGIKRTLGRIVRATIDKNRLGPPLSQVTFNIYFDRGIDDIESWEEFNKSFKVIKKDKSWYKYQIVDEETGEVIELKAHGWANFANEVLKKRPELAESIFQEMADKFILAYQKRSDEMEVTVED